MTLPVHIAFDGLSGVDGSARFSFGPTTALASVSGPIAARPATELPARATIDLHVRPLSAIPGTTQKHVAIALKGILERACILAQHPRTLIQVVVQALSPLSSTRSPDANVDTGEVDVLLAAEINACSLALLNAGSIPMRGVVCAIAVSQPNATSPPRVVTTSGGPNHAEYTGCFAFLFGIDRAHTSMGGTGASGPIPPSKLIWTNYRARPGNTFSATALEEAENVALEGAAEVWMKMKGSLRASLFAGDGQS
ncbi:exosome component Rrp46 [Boletus reticuloceps]|uniref:Exosome component Rrp46 n=1 Tax=Boletus reticuloceps TaxID=495285 RepID=A0A8I2YPG3_9AGAM|nr:exosome component Rrp46 [Boletus reticuloceps]